MQIALVDVTDEQRGRWARALEREELEVTAVASSDAAFKRLDDEHTSAVLLWANTSPERTLHSVRALRRRGLWAPIVVVVREGDEDASVELLDAGADDVLSVPFDADEFVARVRALLRRCQPDEQAEMTFEDLTVHPAKHRVLRGQTAVRLTAREMELLVFLVTNSRRVVSREEIGRAVWAEEGLPDSNVIDVMVGRLRKKLSPGDEPELIHTVVRRGYMLSVTPPGRG